MVAQRKIEVFSAGCSVCNEAIERVREIACESCDVSVLDMHDEEVSMRAKGLGIQSIPAVVINGSLADCCAGRVIDEEALRAAGLGQPIA